MRIYIKRNILIISAFVMQTGLLGQSSFDEDFIINKETFLKSVKEIGFCIGSPHSPDNPCSIVRDVGLVGYEEGYRDKMWPKVTDIVSALSSKSKDNLFAYEYVALRVVNSEFSVYCSKVKYYNKIFGVDICNLEKYAISFFESDDVYSADPEKIMFMSFYLSIIFDSNKFNQIIGSRISKAFSSKALDYYSVDEYYRIFSCNLNKKMCGNDYANFFKEIPSFRMAFEFFYVKYKYKDLNKCNLEFTGNCFVMNNNLSVDMGKLYSQSILYNHFENQKIFLNELNSSMNIIKEGVGRM
ncbi:MULTISPECIES: hypothetical protein [unclassified Azospirillum]|jgi:hypothetical protein|uniref:hypothetical protein n=1 Tax=unclassified Azospirillum TaxID=2630922 RepID=UPI000B6F8176|nr:MULTISPECIES: hypothetical protein [unclassified Azospirillum]SNT19329.1 hypothetical protein SAMN05880556_1323 [Azospirillum sp. RU38E]SNT31183.1 hypothetical protein SAMN05880591_1323 [Azospirillum sp. RU37A]